MRSLLSISKESAIVAHPWDGVTYPSDGVRDIALITGDDVDVQVVDGLAGLMTLIDAKIIC